VKTDIGAAPGAPSAAVEMVVGGRSRTGTMTNPYTMSFGQINPYIATSKELQKAPPRADKSLSAAYRPSTALRDEMGQIFFAPRRASRSRAPRALPPVHTTLHQLPCVATMQKEGEARLALIAPAVVRRRAEKVEAERRKREAKLAKKRDSERNNGASTGTDGATRLPPLRESPEGGQRRNGEPAFHTKQRSGHRSRSSGGKGHAGGPRNMHVLENLDEMSAFLRDEIAGRWSTVRNIFVQCDIDGNGTIDKKEWCLALPIALRMVGQLKAQDASNLFDHFDADGNGELDYNELYMMLRQGSSVGLDAKLKAGAVEFDREATQQYRTRKQARTTKGSNTLHGLMLGGRGGATDGADGAGGGGGGGGGGGADVDPEDVLRELGKALATKLGRIVDLFREWDLDGSGEIDKREFCDAMESVGLHDWSEEKRGALFDQLDDDKSGTIEYKELVRKLRRAARAAADGKSRRAGQRAPRGGGGGPRGHEPDASHSRLAPPAEEPTGGALVLPALV
jgi:Ca2+-binding EF-hand superfamily protein